MFAIVKCVIYRRRWPIVKITDSYNKLQFQLPCDEAVNIQCC